MANYNARDFLRDTIAGDVGNGISQVKTFINKQESYKQDSSLIPPILAASSKLQSEEIIKIIEKKYNLSVFSVFKNVAQQDLQAANCEHALRILDFALDSAINKNFIAASDVFSLCRILCPNYLFDYLLATVRFNLGDYDGALRLSSDVIRKIKKEPIIDEELLSLAKDLDFSKNFYFFYCTLLLFNGQVQKANLILRFLIKNNLIFDFLSTLSLINFFKAVEEKDSVSILSKYFLHLIDLEKSQEIKKIQINNLKNLLQS